MNASARTDRGKLRRLVAKLNDEQFAQYSLAHAQVIDKREPATDSETYFARLWAEILRVTLGRSGVENDSFRLVGDSIAAMRLTARTRADSLELNMLDIFRVPVLENMAVIVKVLGRMRRSRLLCCWMRRLGRMGSMRRATSELDYDYGRETRCRHCLFCL